jgi:cellulose synthase operon protein C
MMKILLPRLAFVAAAALVFAGCSAESRKAKSLARAAAAYQAGELDAARIEYQLVLQKFPEDPAAIKGLALLAADRGATIRAIMLLSKVLAREPNEIDLRLKRAELSLSLGKVTDAREEILEILEKSPSAGGALVLLTETLRDLEELKAADAVLQKFPDKSSASYHLAAANLLRMRGERVKARASVERAIAADANLTGARAVLAAVNAELGQPSLGAAEYKAAVERAPLRSTIRLKHAEYLAQTGALPDAIAAVTEMTRKVPDYLPAWRMLAVFAFREKRYADAEALAEKVLARDALDYEALLQRARIWQVKGETKRAIEEFERIGKVFPRLGLELHHLAVAHLQNNDPVNAIAALKQTVGLFPGNSDAVFMLAQLQLRSGDAEPAATALAHLLNRRPELVQGYALLVEATKAIGKLDELARSLNEKLRVYPNNLQLLHALGLICVQQENVAEARRYFEKIRELSPEFHPATYELINLEIRDGKPAVAGRHAQALIAKLPKAAAAHFLLARAHVAQSRWSDAAAAAAMAIDLEPTYGEAYAVLAKALSEIKDPGERVSRVEGFLANHANELPAVLLAGQVYLNAKEVEKLKALYEKHLVAKPNETVVLNNLANLYADELGQTERALQLARKASELDPASGPIADTLGWLLYRTGKFAEALPLLETAVRNLPGNPELQYHLGMVSLKLGRNEAALAAFRAMAKHPAEFAGKEEGVRTLSELEKSPTATPGSGVPKQL